MFQNQELKKKKLSASLGNLKANTPSEFTRYFQTMLPDKTFISEDTKKKYIPKINFTNCTIFNF